MGLTENEDGNRFKVMIHFQPSHLDAEQAEALPRMIHNIFNLKEVFDGGQGSAGDWVDHDCWYEIYDDAHTVYSMFEDLSSCMGIDLNPVLCNAYDDEGEYERWVSSGQCDDDMAGMTDPDLDEEVVE